MFTPSVSLTRTPKPVCIIWIIANLEGPAVTSVAYFINALATMLGVTLRASRKAISETKSRYIDKRASHSSSRHEKR